MEENTINTSPTPVESQTTSTPFTGNTNDAVSPSLLKRPMFWLGIGAVIILILGYLYMSISPATSSNQQKESTEAVQIKPTGTIEIHEQTEADAIDVGNIDNEFTDIEKDVNQL